MTSWENFRGMWGIYETREQELRHSVMSYWWVRRHFGAIRNHFVTICDDCSKFRAKGEGMRHTVMSRVDFQAIRGDSAKFWISYDDLDWVRVGFKALRWSRGDLGTIESQFGWFNDDSGKLWTINDDWLTVYGTQRQLCGVGDDLRVFCDDLDQFREVAGNLRRFVEIATDSEAVESSSRKLSGVVVMWDRVGGQFRWIGSSNTIV